MERRDLLQTPWAAALALAGADRLLAQPAARTSRAGLVVRAGSDRHDAPFTFLDGLFHVLVSGADTDGRFVMFDTRRTLKSGPALHMHTDCDEWFLVLDGVFKFQLGDRIVQAAAGDSLLAPLGLPHAFVKIGEGTARMLVMHQPAGTMEAYFREGAARPGISPDERRVLAEQHGMKILGGPLSPE